MGVSENIFHLCIGKPLGASYSALIEPGMGNMTVMVKIHLSGKGQPVNMRIKTANAVTQCLRQHRDASIRKIYASPPLVSLFIQTASLFHIMRHICDGHP